MSNGLLDCSFSAGCNPSWGGGCNTQCHTHTLQHTHADIHLCVSTVSITPTVTCKAGFNNSVCVWEWGRQLMNDELWNRIILWSSIQHWFPPESPDKLLTSKPTIESKCPTNILFYLFKIYLTRKVPLRLKIYFSSETWPTWRWRERLLFSAKESILYDEGNFPIINENVPPTYRCKLLFLTEIKPCFVIVKLCWKLRTSLNDKSNESNAREDKRKKRSLWRDSLIVQPHTTQWQCAQGAAHCSMTRLNQRKMLPRSSREPGTSAESAETKGDEEKPRSLTSLE